MPTPANPLTTDDLHTLARLTELHIAPDRESAVLAELNHQVANLRLIETLLPAPNPAATQPYDPTFPIVRGDEVQVP